MHSILGYHGWSPKYTTFYTVKQVSMYTKTENNFLHFITSKWNERKKISKSHSNYTKHIKLNNILLINGPLKTSREKLVLLETNDTVILWYPNALNPIKFGTQCYFG